MNASQTIEQEIAAVTSGNKLYQTYRPQYQFLLNSYLGGSEYRDAGYLTRYQLETDAEYAARLATTPLDNHCQSVVSVYNSFLFRVAPEREFGLQESSQELQDFLKDADFDGRSLDSFMKDIATWSSIFGHCWAILAKPNVGAVTLADEQALGVRPYISLLTPMVVLDWSWSRSASGRYALDYFKYIEDINGDIQTVKEWTPELIRTRVVDTKEHVILDDIAEPNGLGLIPAIIAYNGRSMVRGIGVSDIADIATAQKFLYNATSEIDQSIRMDSHPSLVCTPETQVGTGSGSLIKMPENLDPGLRPYLLEFSGASVDSIVATMKHVIDSIDKMANTGAIRAVESRTLSGVAMQTEFELLNARLAEKADNLELFEEHMWRLWNLYQGQTSEITVEYPGSFNIRDTQAEIDQLVKVKNAATDPRVHALVDHELVEFLGEDASVILPEIPAEQQHPMTTPEDRQQHIQDMIMQGYLDEEILDIHPEITADDILSAKQALLDL